MTSTAVFVGVDIAKTDFVVACRPDGTSWTAPNDLDGIPATVGRLRALVPTLIVLEATGGYETSLGRNRRGGHRPIKLLIFWALSGSGRPMGPAAREGWLGGFFPAAAAGHCGRAGSPEPFLL